MDIRDIDGDINWKEYDEDIIPGAPVDFKTYYNNEDELYYDAIEKDPVYREIFVKVEKEVEAEMKKIPWYGAMGSCHAYWDKKKEILKKKYDVDWHTPAECNPDVLFD